jgi:hypothetical protein
MSNVKSLASLLLLIVLLTIAAGCGTSSPTPVAAGPSAAGAPYLLSSEPAEAKTVLDARADTKDADDIVLVGRIGGDTSPWVNGQAAFLVVDGSLKPCNEKDDDDCPTPWDYCCDGDTLPKSKAVVKVVDRSGKTVATDARELLGLQELQTVVVQGRAARDEAGNLTVLADGIFVRK